MVAIHRKYIYEIVEDLRELSGRNDKIELLKEALDKNADFKIAVEMTYNPYKNYHLGSLDNLLTVLNRDKFGSSRGTRTFRHVVPVLEAINDHGSLPGRMKVTLYKKLIDLNEIDRKAVDLILKGSLDCGISVSSINKACPGLIPEFKVLLCEKLSSKNIENIQYPAIAQLKMDGMRALVFIEGDKITIRSRSGKELTTHGVFHETLFKHFGGQANCVLDGELLTVKDGKFEARKTSNGICNKAVRGTIKQEDAEKLVFIAWDIVSVDQFWKGESKVPYSKRLKVLQDKLNPSDSRLSVVETMEVEDYHDVNRYFQKALEKGEEGIILKNRDFEYVGKRTKECIKFKAEKTADLEIVEVLEGAGKYSGQLGAFSCTSKDGTLQVKVGSGFSDLQRTDLFSNSLVGQIVEVKYNEVIEDKFGDKSLFLPVFVGIREDKKDANTIEEL